MASFSRGYQFPPAALGLAGFFGKDYFSGTTSIVDQLAVPGDLTPGDYVLSWRLVGPNLIHFSSINLYSMLQVGCGSYKSSLEYMFQYKNCYIMRKLV